MSDLSKQHLVNFIGGAGYLASALNWLFVVIILLPFLLNSSSYQQFVTPEPAAPSPEVTAPGAEPLPGADALWMFVGFIIALVFIVIACLLLIKIPLSIARTGQKITAKSSGSLAPVLIKHKIVKQTSKSKLSTRLNKLIKLAIALLPVAFGFASQLLNTGIDSQVVIFLTSLIAAVAIVLFSTQYYLARWLKVNANKVL